MSKEFIWTDELVKQYAGTRLEETIQDMEYFKEQVMKKEQRIEVMDIQILSKDGTWIRTEKYKQIKEAAEAILNNDAKAYWETMDKMAVPEPTAVKDDELMFKAMGELKKEMGEFSTGFPKAATAVKTDKDREEWFKIGEFQFNNNELPTGYNKCIHSYTHDNNLYFIIENRKEISSNNFLQLCFRYDLATNKLTSLKSYPPSFKDSIEKKFTQEQMDAAREDAFNAGGSKGSVGVFRHNRSISDTWSFPAFNDYKNSIKP